MGEVLITIFTATYNRAHTLHRVYESLAAQTFRNFEWLVIDDGSTDNTAEKVACWQRIANFPIRYYHQPNFGKHVAHNNAAQLAQGELFLFLDSDDGCIPEALARMAEVWESIPVEQRDTYTGVTSRCVDQYGNRVGADFAQDPWDTNLLYITYIARQKCEMWGAVRTGLARANPYPTPAHTIYVPESVLWNRLARQYKTRFVNDRLRVYYVNEGNDTMSGSGVMSYWRLWRMAPGLARWHEEALLSQMDYFVASPHRLYRAAVHFVRFSWIMGRGIRGQWNTLPSAGARLLLLAAALPGTLVYLRDRFLLPKK